MDLGPVGKKGKSGWDSNIINGLLIVFICWWVDLCPCPVICLARGALELVPIDCWARAGLGPEVHKLEGGFQNGVCQHQCPHGRMSSPEWLPPVSMSPGGAAVAPSFSRRFSKISRWVWPSLLLLLLPWIPEHVSEVSISPQLSGTLNYIHYWSSKPNALGVHFPGIWPTGYGAHFGAQIPHS